MNKIFKVVWSKVRNAYVVVSEIANNTVSGVGKRNRVKRFSMGATLAAVALTSSFFVSNCAWAAELTSATYENYVVLKGSSDSSTGVLYIYDKNGQIYNIGSSKEILGYNYVLKKVNDNYFWVREGYDVKITNNDKYFEGAKVDYKISPYATGNSPSSEHLVFAAKNGIVDTADKTAVNNDILHKLTYTNYAAGTNGGIQVPEGWDYIYYRDGQSIENVKGNLTESFKEVTYNSSTGHYQYNGQDVPFENVYAITLYKRNASGVIEYNDKNEPILDDKMTVGVFLTSQGEVYTGPVYGLNNEILITAYDGQSQTWSTVWGAEMSDPNASIASMTVGQFQDVLDNLHSEDVILSNADIEKTVVNGTDGTINLKNKKGNVIPGITISRSADDSKDTVITISDAGNGTIRLETGSRVVANPSEGTVSNDSLNSISINGIKYNIAVSSGEMNNLSVSSGYGRKSYIDYGSNDEDNTVAALSNEKHGWVLTDVKQNEITFKDTTLVAGTIYANEDVSIDGSDGDTDSSNSTRYYTIYDTAGNKVVLDDVASHLELQDAEVAIGENTTAIGKNTEAIETLGGKVATNTANIVGLTTRVGKAETDIIANTGRIGTIENTYVKDITKDGNTLKITQGNGVSEITLTDKDTTNAGLANAWSGDDVTITLTDSAGNDVETTISGVASASNLTTEITNRTNADAALQGSINALGVRVTTNEGNISSNTGRIGAIESNYVKDITQDGNTLKITQGATESTITFTDNDTNTYTTSGVYNNQNKTIDFVYNGSNATAYSVDVSGLATTVVGTRTTVGGVDCLSKITINDEEFYVPVVVPNANVGTNDTNAPVLESINLNGVVYRVASFIEGEGHDYQLTGEINSTDSTNTPKGEQSGHYQLDESGSLRLNMLEKLTGNVEVGKIVVDGIASRDYVDGAIATEKAEREAADNSLSEAISAEANTRYLEDQALQQNINANKTAIEAEVTAREAADNNLSEAISAEANTRYLEDQALQQNINANKTAIEAEVAAREAADVALQANIDAEAAERFANDIASGAINSQNGTISLTKNNGETITLDGAICDSRLDDVSYDASTGKMTFTVKDHYNNDVQNSIVVSDIASKTALEKEVSDRIAVDNYLYETMNKNDQYLDSKINQLGSKVNKVGAGAAALAALHPMDFDPDDKLSFAVGAGNYAGETATALGAFYRPNEKVMMNVAGTYGNGENMVNMGVSFALDRTNNVSNSRTAMAKEIVDLREQVATQGQQIAQLVALVQQLTGVQQPVVPGEQLFPDIPENHWAYEYIYSLAAKGIVEGYPDGNFGGDRTMTRYEFATMLFKAMQNGVVLSEQIRQEFEKELGRIRVDRVKGADDDANKIERVRVNADVDRDDYGSKVVQVKH